MQQEVSRGTSFTLTAPADTERDADPWGVTFRVYGEGIEPESYAAVIEDGEWTASVPAGDTRSWPVGEYAYEGALSNGGDVAEIIERGRFRMVASALAGDVRTVERTFAEQALEAVEELLIVASASSELSISTGGHSFSFETRDDLLAFRSKLKQEVDRESPNRPRSRVIRARLTDAPRSRRVL